MERLFGGEQLIFSPSIQLLSLRLEVRVVFLQGLGERRFDLAPHIGVEILGRLGRRAVSTSGSARELQKTLAGLRVEPSPVIGLCAEDQMLFQLEALQLEQIEFQPA